MKKSYYQQLVGLQALGEIRLQAVLGSHQPLVGSVAIAFAGRLNPLPSSRICSQQLVQPAPPALNRRLEHRRRPLQPGELLARDVI